MTSHSGSSYRRFDRLAIVGVMSFTIIVSCVVIETTAAEKNERASDERILIDLLMSLTQDEEANIEARFRDSKLRNKVHIGRKSHIRDHYDPSNDPHCGQPAIPPYVESDNSNRIIGGLKTVPNSWPWQCSLQHPIPYGNRWTKCGCVVIPNPDPDSKSSRVVLTAAHCVKRHLNDATRSRVVLGAHNITETYGLSTSSTTSSNPTGLQIIGVSRFIVHPDYMLGGNTHNDIALVVLSTPFQFGPTVSPVCLPTFNVSTGTYCYVTGWGYTRADETHLSGVLRQVVVPVIDQSVCRQYKLVTDNMLCAGYPAGGLDACKGDSGGPLVCLCGKRWYLHGLVSFKIGSGCARPNHPNFYTRVASYVTWIVDQLQGLDKNGDKGSHKNQ